MTSLAYLFTFIALANAHSVKRVRKGKRKWLNSKWEWRQTKRRCSDFVSPIEMLQTLMTHRQKETEGNREGKWWDEEGHWASTLAWLSVLAASACVHWCSSFLFLCFLFYFQTIPWMHLVQMNFNNLLLNLLFIQLRAFPHMHGSPHISVQMHMHQSSQLEF